jgi:hypothetical protein
MKDKPIISTAVSGNEMFANVGTLTMDRVSREENVNRYRSNCYHHPIL